MDLVPINLAGDAGSRWKTHACFAIFCAAGIVLPWIGPGPLNVRNTLNLGSLDSYIFFQLRVTRTLLGLIAGGALSLAGVLFQAVLRDALATPYTLGVSTGASLGAVLMISSGWQTLWGVPAIWTGALAGAFVVLLLVMSTAARRRRLSAFGLLLTGVAINSVCSSLILLLHSLAGVSRSFSISRWLIGSIDAASYGSLAAFAAVVFVTGSFVVMRAKSWNLMAVDEQWAATRGVNASALLFKSYVLGSVLTAGAIALTGPIGFVGLMVPHLVRARLSSDHRVLMPCAFFLGGTLLSFCDAAGRVVLAPAEVPAGVILALLGGPYLAWLVWQRM
jgi:iron complex transport system permease protein